MWCFIFPKCWLVAQHATSFPSATSEVPRNDSSATISTVCELLLMNSVLWGAAVVWTTLGTKSKAAAPKSLYSPQTFWDCLSQHRVRKHARNFKAQLVKMTFTCQFVNLITSQLQTRQLTWLVFLHKYNKLSEDKMHINWRSLVRWWSIFVIMSRNKNLLQQ